MSSEANDTRILVVDDTESVREAIKMILDSSGYKIEVARDGAEALKCQSVNPFPIVLTDILMPNRDGFELIRELRKHFPETRIIAMSGGGSMAMPACLDVAALLGAKQVLSKPFSADELLQAIVSAQNN